MDFATVSFADAAQAVKERRIKARHVARCIGDYRYTQGTSRQLVASLSHVMSPLWMAELRQELIKRDCLEAIPADLR
jgi:hypothetical protein